MNTAIHWFRRDLRVTDNTALNEAARRAERVIPVFILADTAWSAPEVSPVRRAFLRRSLEALRARLTDLGYPLVFRQGSAVEILPQLARELGAEAVFCNKRSEPHAIAQDEKVFHALNAAGIGFEAFKDAVVWEEREILTQAGAPYTVFTPYAKAWRSRRVPAPRPALAAVRKWSVGVAPSQPKDAWDRGDKGDGWGKPLPPAGEAAALAAMNQFLEHAIFEYAEARDFPAIEGTSRLSMHLRAGTVGIRTVLAGVSAARRKARTAAQQKGCEVFLTELIWREFYHQVLANFPHVANGAFRPEYDSLKWSLPGTHFQAWREGQTGYPIVDAAMRCLNATGWMHNRLRMIVAMFLTKDLLISWQEGEKHFKRQLIDGDLAANNGGWQWSAGTGTDAAPYFRIFNPVAQGERFDPEGAFVRRWVPELADLPADRIHRPWEKPSAAGSLKYPARIVIHEEQRPKCLAMFGKVKSRR